VSDSFRSILAYLFLEEKEGNISKIHQHEKALPMKNFFHFAHIYHKYATETPESDT
jgi:hypothetical protein